MSYTLAILRSDGSATDDTVWSRVAAAFEVDDETASEDFQRLHDALTEHCPCMSQLPDEEIDDAVWSDGPLINTFGKDSAVLGVGFSAVDHVLPFVIETANSHGMLVADEQTGLIHRPGDLVLMVEDEEPVKNPTADAIAAAIQRMTPDGGPGFAVLSAPRDYVQTAGGDGEYTVEWREYRGFSFHHWVAGSDSPPGDNVEIRTNGFAVGVKENERLAADDVLAIFSAFREREERPATYSWRDVTERFQ